MLERRAAHVALLVVITAFGVLAPFGRAAWGWQRTIIPGTFPFSGGLGASATADGGVVLVGENAFIVVDLDRATGE